MIWTLLKLTHSTLQIGNDVCFDVPLEQVSHWSWVGPKTAL
jgi:hypothetical protein